MEKILARPDHSIEDVLDEEDLLQELLAPNAKVIEYLRQPDVMKEIIKYVIPSEEERKENERQGEEEEESKEGEKDGSEEKQGEEENEGENEGKDRDQEEGKEKEDNKDENKESSAKPSEPNEKTEENEGQGEGSSDDGEDHEEFEAEKSSKLEPQQDRDGSDEDDDDNDETSGSELSRHLHQHDHHYGYDDDDEGHDFENMELPEAQRRQSYGNLCCEILSADVWSIVETLIGNDELLDMLWSVLDCKGTLDIRYASYFTKINEHLLIKKTDELLHYIMQQDNFSERFVRQIDNPPLMDFLLKVITSDKPADNYGVTEFLQRQGFIMSLIKCLGPDKSSSFQSAAGDFLKAFITISANSNHDANTIGPNELTRELVGREACTELLQIMLTGGTSLATGVGVIIEIIRKNNSDYDATPVGCTTLESHPPSPRDPIYLGTLVDVFADAIPKFYEILTRKHTEQVETPFGEIEPLGFERFKICELIAELLHCSNMILLNDKEGAEIVRVRDAERRRRRGLMDAAESPGEMINKFDDMEINRERERGREQEGSQDIEIDVASNVEQQEQQQHEGVDAYDSESTGATEEELAKIEAELRKDPVVGDKLKIGLYDEHCITYIVSMFFRFPWNNFLHNVVFDIVQQLLNGRMQEGYNRFLAIQLFGEAKITEAICNGHIACDDYERQNQIRLGYMGHLTLISEEVVKFTAMYSPESISPVVQEAVQQTSWISYVTNTLVRTREQYNSILGGKRPDSSVYMTNPDAIIPSHEGDEDEMEEDDNLHSYDMNMGMNMNVDMNLNMSIGGGGGVHHGSGEVDDEEDEELAAHFASQNDSHGLKEFSQDQFARYMSQEMGEGAGNIGSSDEDDDEEDWVHDRGAYNRLGAGGGGRSGELEIEDEQEEDIGARG